MVRPRIGYVSPPRWLRLPVFAICLLALVVLVVRLVRPSVSDSPPNPSLHSRQVLWVCEKDSEHQFTNHFRFEALPCAKCGDPCAIQLDYVCPKHEGIFSSLVRFTRTIAESKGTDADNGAIVSEYRYLNSSNWAESDGKVLCPVTSCTLPARRAKMPWSVAKPALSAPD